MNSQNIVVKIQVVDQAWLAGVTIFLYKSFHVFITGVHRAGKISIELDDYEKTLMVILYCFAVNNL